MGQTIVVLKHVAVPLTNLFCNKRFLEILNRSMLRFITDLTDNLLDYIKDDPVRPEISREFRVCDNHFISALINDQPEAMVCVSLQDSIPATVEELLNHRTSSPTMAIFYTIWSYRPGAGSQLLRETVAEIQKMFPGITRFITLSPKTEMAEKFHLRNGAVVFRENQETINYEYL